MKFSILRGLAALIFLLAVNLYAQVDDVGGSIGSSRRPDKKGPSGSKVIPFNGVEIAIEITKEEAAKKYPPPRGGYPPAEMTTGPGTIKSNESTSPYPPHHKFDTSGIPHGALLLDPYAKHVFIQP